jgi:hypothetical protein
MITVSDERSHQVLATPANRGKPTRPLKNDRRREFAAAEGDGACLTVSTTLT